jgi:MFS family permease
LIGPLAIIAEDNSSLGLRAYAKLISVFFSARPGDRLEILPLGEFFYYRNLNSFFLISINSKNAISRGRKPGLFIILSLLFLFGGELSGAFIGYVATKGQLLATYFFALMGGASGAVIISYLIAKLFQRPRRTQTRDYFRRSVFGRASDFDYRSRKSVYRRVGQF